MLMTLRVCSRPMHSWVKVYKIHYRAGRPNRVIFNYEADMKIHHDYRTKKNVAWSRNYRFFMWNVSHHFGGEDERWLAQGRQSEARHANQERHRRRIWRRKIYVSWTEREKQRREEKSEQKKFHFDLWAFSLRLCENSIGATRNRFSFLGSLSVGFFSLKDDYEK